ncbi:C-C motif chemokine 25b isoform 1-T2 [Syngnathus typhle]
MCTIRVQSPTSALQRVVRQATLSEAAKKIHQPSRTARGDMKFQALLFLVLLFCTTVCLAQEADYPTVATLSGSYGDCCLGHVGGMKTKTKEKVQSYRIQETDGDCNIRAVVFTVKKRPGRKAPRTICANPEDIWVQELMEVVRLRRMLQN